MKVIRSMSPDGWVPIANATAQNRALSWRAKGLLLELLSYPDGFNITFERLMKMAKAAGGADVEGRDAMRRAMQELERKGYLSHRRITADGPSNQRWKTETAVCDLPNLNDDPGGTGFQYPQDSVPPDFSTTKDQEVINNTGCNKTKKRQEETTTTSPSGTVYLCGSCGQPSFDGEYGPTHFDEQWDGVHCPWFPLAGTRLQVEWDEMALDQVRAEYPDTYPHSAPSSPAGRPRRRV